MKELVCGCVEETLHEMLEAEDEKLTQAARYGRKEARQGCGSSYYNPIRDFLRPRDTPYAPPEESTSFETVIMKWFRRRESSIAESFIEYTWLVS